MPFPIGVIGQLDHHASFQTFFIGHPSLVFVSDRSLLFFVRYLLDKSLPSPQPSLPEMERDF